jgi:hypothetical protein
VALINPDDARPASRDMVENLFCHLEAHAKPLQARRGRAAQIVKPPIRHAGLRVKSRFRFRPAVERSAKLWRHKERQEHNFPEIHRATTKTQALTVAASFTQASDEGAFAALRKCPNPD